MFNNEDYYNIDYSDIEKAEYLRERDAHNYPGREFIIPQNGINMAGNGSGPANIAFRKKLAAVKRGELKISQAELFEEAKTILRKERELAEINGMFDYDYE